MIWTFFNSVGNGAREKEEPQAHINISTCSKIRSVYYEIRIRTKRRGDWVERGGGGARESTKPESNINIKFSHLKT